MEFGKMEAILPMMEAKGVPAPMFALITSNLIKLVGVLSIMLGYKHKIGSMLLIIYLLPVTFFMHNFWTIEDPNEMFPQLIFFIRNFSIIGVLMMIYVLGTGPGSLEKKGA